MTCFRNEGRHGFTQTELLIVMVITLLLMALLLPAVKLIRAQAVRTECASNLRQCGLTLFALAGDNEGLLLDVNPIAEMHRMPEGAAQLANYCDVMTIFTCPVYKVLRLQTIDKSAGYMTYSYFPGHSFPLFRDGQGWPREISKVSQSIVMSDVLFDAVVWNYVSANHGSRLSEPIRSPGWPASAQRRGPRSALTASLGANSLMGDGRVEYHNLAGLKNYGSMYNWCEVNVFAAPLE